MSLATSDSSGLLCLFLFSLSLCSGLVDSTNNFDNSANELVLDEAKVPLSIQVSVTNDVMECWTNSSSVTRLIYYFSIFGHLQQ